MAYNETNLHKTLIIPVVKMGNFYRIDIADVLWNEFQSLVLEGAIKKKIIIEFDIKKDS